MTVLLTVLFQPDAKKPSINAGLQLEQGSGLGQLHSLIVAKR